MFNYESYLNVCQLTPEKFGMFTHYESQAFFALVVSFFVMVLMVSPLAFFSLSTIKIFVKEYAPSFKKTVLHSILLGTIFMSIMFPFVYGIYVQENEVNDKSDNYKIAEAIYVYAKEFPKEIKENPIKLHFYKNLFADEKILGCEEKFFIREIFNEVNTKEKYTEILKKHVKEGNIDIIKEVKDLFK